MKICIVGAGPAGLYTARELCKLKGIKSIKIIDKQKKPYGLLRYGVAPDRPEFKRLIPYFNEFLQNNSNVHLMLNEKINDFKSIERDNDFVIAAIGASLPISCSNVVVNKRTIINGTQLAAAFNNEIDHLNFDRYIKDLVIIGFGNVALDCARIAYKIRHGLITINEKIDQTFSRLRNITFICRKPFVFQQSCTLKEFRDLMDVCAFKAHIIEEAKGDEHNLTRKEQRLNSLMSKIRRDESSFIRIICNDEIQLVDDNLLITKRQRRIPYQLLVQCIGQRSEEIGLESKKLLKVGWCLHNGKGTISDCYHDAKGISDYIGKFLKNTIF